MTTGGTRTLESRVSLTIPIDGFRVKAVASRHAVVPGAEEFAPSITGLWLPPGAPSHHLDRRHLQTGADAPHGDLA
jgi:hypothetical protein